MSVIALTALSVALSAQDIISTVDGRVLNVTVTDISPSQIEYIQDGVPYTMPASRLLTVRFADKDTRLLADYKKREMTELPAETKTNVSPVPGRMAALSAALPGLGQMKCGNVGSGIAFLAGTGALTATGVYFFCQSPNSYYAMDNTYFFDKNIVGGAFIISAAGLYIWNILDAAGTAKKKGKSAPNLAFLPQGVTMSIAF